MRLKASSHRCALPRGYEFPAPDIDQMIEETQHG